MHINKEPLTVRYAETDQMGVVYHANYLVWFEVGRTAFFKELGFDYTKVEEEGYITPVLDVTISYKQPVKYGDDVTVHTWVEHYDGLRIIYGYEVHNQNGLCTSGTTSHVCVKRNNFRPVSVKKNFPDWHTEYENKKKK